MNLIEKLELEKQCWHDDGENNVHRVIDDCIDIVKQHSDWISVDERLPDKDAVVLVYKQEYGLIGTAKYSGNGFWGFDNQTRDPMHKFTFMGGVTHWQPLPQPPSEVQDD